MKTTFIDTNIVIRALAKDKDNPEMGKTSRELLLRVRDGVEVVIAPIALIFEAVYVLEKQYSFPREDIRDSLSQIIKLPGFKIENKTVIFDALDTYVSKNIPFVDAIMIATVKSSDISEIYSFDKHFNNVDGIKRVEP